MARMLQSQDCHIKQDASTLITGFVKTTPPHPPLPHILEKVTVKQGTKAQNQPKEKHEQSVTTI